MNHVENLWPDWETVRLIDRGSFGTVYEIRRNLFGEAEHAALKVISIPQNQSDIEELYNEGYSEEGIALTLRHHLENIVAEYSHMQKLKSCGCVVRSDDIRYVSHSDGLGWDIFIKMELLTPLIKVLPAYDDEQTILKIAKDICTALVHCQAHKLIHRDIKPHNIFVSPEGTFKLGDFGISKVMEKTSGATKIGTYKYMAPEVYNNQPYNATVDIYSLGLVLYWLLNERRMPFLPLPPKVVSADLEESARMDRINGHALPEPAHGSQKLKQVVLKACAHDPQKRYATAEEMLEALIDVTAVQNKPASSPRRTSLKWLLLPASILAVAGAIYIGTIIRPEPILTGWQKFENHTYYYDSQGVPVANRIIIIDGNRYYFDETASMQTGWLSIGNETYYLGNDGIMYTGWLNIDNNTYYFNNDGTMYTGWLNIDNNTYYFNNDGTMYTGWLNIGNNTYYLDQHGIMVSGTQVVDGTQYTFSETGELKTGWIQIDTDTYYLDEVGLIVTGWQKIDGLSYFFNEKGILQTGWQTINAQTYYFTSDGIMVTGTQEIDNTLYTFDSNGILRLALVTPPENCFVERIGDTATVTIIVDGDGLTYEWWAKDTVDTFYYKSPTRLTNVYTAKLDEERNGREVYCKVTDKYGNVLETKSVFLRVKE